MAMIEVAKKLTGGWMALDLGCCWLCYLPDNDNG